jgi:hypothetical protein
MKYHTEPAMVPVSISARTTKPICFSRLIVVSAANVNEFEFLHQEIFPDATSIQRVEIELVIRVMFGCAYRCYSKRGNEQKRLVLDDSVCARHDFEEARW